MRHPKELYKHFGQAVLGGLNSIKLHFIGDVGVSTSADGRQIKGVKLHIASVELFANKTVHFFICPPGSQHGTVSLCGLNTALPLAWQIKPAPVGKDKKVLPTLKLSSTNFTVNVDSSEFLTHKDMTIPSKIALSIPCLVLDQELVTLTNFGIRDHIAMKDSHEKELAEGAAPAGPKASKRRKKTRAPDENAYKLLPYPQLLRPVLQCELDKSALSELRKAERAKEESQSSESQGLGDPFSRQFADECPQGRAFIDHLLR